MSDLYYEEIFATNGASYHKAMSQWPNVRDQEFEAVLDILDIRSGDRVLDVPAGGGYLKAYLPEGTRYIGRDFAASFGDSSHNQVLKCSETDLGFEVNSFDYVICLASLHHIENKAEFFKGVGHILKPSGRFLIGDVVKGTAEGAFLNGFVNDWNKLGHDGDFIDVDRERSLLSHCGFTSTFTQRHDRWVFDDQQTACDYFRHLFTLNKSPEDLDIVGQLSALKSGAPNVGAHTLYDIEWSLGFLEARLK